MKNGWVVKKLGELCEINTGKSNTEDAIENGEFAFFDRSKIVKKSSKYLLNCAAIIVAGEGQKFLPKFFSGKFDLHQRAYAIYNFRNDVSIHYAYKYLIHFHKYFEEVAVGATAKSLRLRHFQDLPIPIPPLQEQKQIVITLDKAFAAIDKAKENAQKNLKNAKALLESYLQEVFENKGDDWNRKRVNEVCELKSGTTISTSLEKDEGDVLYTKVGDMNLPENLVEINTSSRFVNRNEIKANQIIPEGATIFPKRGGAIATNKKRKIIKPTIVDLNTMAIIPSNRINKDYFFHWFQLFDLKSISNGANIPQINNYSFDEIYISFPESLEKQKQIVTELNHLQEKTKALETIYQQKLANLEELKKSILQKAFNGELSNNANLV
jgi:type I restriction enzyme S subunit